MFDLFSRVEKHIAPSESRKPALKGGLVRLPEDRVVFVLLFLAEKLTFVEELVLLKELTVFIKKLTVFKERLIFAR